MARRMTGSGCTIFCVVSTRDCGAIAQLVERRVRNAKVWGSIPHSSTIMESVGRSDQRVPFFVQVTSLTVAHL